MVYTVTFNPAIDYVVHVDDMEPGMTNRTKSEEIYFGGKGINVSIVLKELGITSKALGFVAGFTGKAIEEGMQDMGVDTDFVTLESGNSRINVKIKSKEETELNAQGPRISESAINEIFDKLSKLEDGDTLVLAGSIPNTLPADIYEKILASLQDKEIKSVVDATGDLLLNVLKYKPFLIKPNNHELGEMFKTEIKNNDDVIKYAKKLRELGARNVLISMAGDGAILIDENDEVHHLGVCKGTVKNSVGAGDSMVAGFIAGSSTGDYEYALKLGTATGGATAFSDGLAKRADIDALLKTL
ncbi:MAG: 1-phosphofructokinase [Lachnospiraceae bacterium]|nr:1-phosphofructokinase [Lachnospiraceae bacterium]